MKKSVLFSAFVYCIGLPQAQAMELIEEDLSTYTRHALMSLAVCGDKCDGAKEARKRLEKLGYACEKEFADDSLHLRLQAWKRPDEKKPIFAVCGTDFEGYTRLEYAYLNDLVFPQFALKGDTFIDDFKQFCAADVREHQNNKRIHEWESWKTLFTYYTFPDPKKNNAFNSDMTSYDLGWFKTPKHDPNFVLKYSVAYGLFYGAFTASLPITGGVAALSGITYGIGKLTEYMDPPEIRNMFAASQKTLRTINEWAKDYETYDLTGYSAGGFHATMALTEKVPEEIIIFNAPGGVEPLRKKREKDFTGYWSFVREVSRPQAINITRKHGIIGCYGGDDGTRKSMLVYDYCSTRESMRLEDYFKANHSMFHLTNDLLMKHKEMPLNINRK